jgi:tRNA G37 N-methylase TrmD
MKYSNYTCSIKTLYDQNAVLLVMNQVVHILTITLYKVNLIIGQEEQLQQDALKSKSIEFSTFARARRWKQATSPTLSFSGQVDTRRKDSSFVEECEIRNTVVDVGTAEN